MFEQAFVDVKGKTPPYAMALSLFVQVFVLGVLLVIPLLYTQVLPGVTLRSVLAAPAPPPTPPPPRRNLATPPARLSEGRVFNLPAFAIRQLSATKAQAMAAAPDSAGAAPPSGS